MGDELRRWVTRAGGAAYRGRGKHRTACGSMLSGMREKLVRDKVPATAGNLGRSRNDGPGDLPIGGGKARSREPTILGVAVPEQTEAAVAPVVVPPPPSEKTVLGVGMKGLPGAPRRHARETSVQEPPPEGWDLPQPEQQLPPEPPQATANVAAYLKEYEPKRVPPPATDPSVPIDLSVPKEQSEPSLVPAAVPRRRGTLWWVLLLVLAAVGYVRREQLRPLLIGRWHQVMERAKSHW